MPDYIIHTNVSDETNYIAHYGVKGMKWHKNLFGKPESAEDAYRRRQREKAVSDLKTGATNVADAAHRKALRARGTLKRTTTSIERGVNNLKRKVITPGKSTLKPINEAYETRKLPKSSNAAKAKGAEQNAYTYKLAGNHKKSCRVRA